MGTMLIKVMHEMIHTAIDTGTAGCQTATPSQECATTQSIPFLAQQS